MRQGFVKSFLKLAEKDEKLCFLTGDLGFAMLEPIREVLGDRFINAGIAEQNMMSVAAGLCRSGMHPWVYSIAPFCYARPFEQVRNDICLHNLPVRIVGGGGGFGYGTAGPTHHALEDCGVMSSLQNMMVYAPSFSSDFEALLEELSLYSHPAYLRVARDEMPGGEEPPKEFKLFRQLAAGARGLIIGLGAMACVGWDVHLQLPESMRPSVWACSILPFVAGELDDALKKQIEEAEWLIVLEDHVANGGLGGHLARAILEAGLRPRRFIHRHVKGYVSGLYGSQEFHREENGLSQNALVDLVMTLNGATRQRA